ncbi:MAG: cytochrome c oxidase subunit, partial [Actinomycetota bacterium]|nr:cytochrome c oxidase subunit [Actinomycetota bacterium]
MTLTAEPRQGATVAPELPHRRKGNVVVRWMTTTDHKVIGQLYLMTSFVFFLIGGLMAMIMRAELARPNNQIVSNDRYNQLFTMHGTIMLLLFATPLFVG